MVKSGTVSGFLCPDAVFVLILFPKGEFTMTRNIRKIVSVICAVALLLSLCTVSLIGSTSAAINSNDDATVVTTYETIKTYDFNNASGFGYKRYIDGFSYVDGGVRLANNGNGGGVYFATDPAHTELVNHKNGAAASSLLKLDANATYRVSLTYKCLVGSTKGGVLLLVAPDATGTTDTAAPKKNDGYISIIETQNAFPGTYSPALTADSEVKTVVYTFTVGAKAINIGLSPDQNGGKFWVDEVVIEKGSMSIQLNDMNNEYNFDYTDEAIQTAVLDRMGKLNATQAHYSWYNWNDFKFNASGSASYPGLPGFTAEGMKFHVGKGADIAEGTTSIWASNALVYGDGNDDGWGNLNTKYLRFRDEATYLITVKYKVTQVTTNVTLALGYMNNCTTGSVSVIDGSVVKHNTVTEDWQYLTVAVDTAEKTAMADKILTLTGCVSNDQKWATVIVDSVKVQEKRDVANGTAVMVYDNKGAVSYDLVSIGSMTLPVPENDNPDAAFAGWYTSTDYAEGTKVDMNGFVPQKGTNKLYAKWVNTASVVKFDNQGVVTEQKFAVGLDLPDPVRPNAYLFFEGWYLEPTFKTQITTVPDYDVTLYAKYNGTFLGFNNISHVEGEATGSPAIVVDPDDANNNVVLFEAGKSSRPNFMLPAYDIVGSAGFELKPNTSYVVSYKVKKADAEGADAGITFYQGDHKSGDSTTRTAIGGSSTSVTSADWATETFSFTTGETLYLERVKWSYQNHVFFTIYNGSSKISVYVDDICIAEALTEAPEGTVGIFFETNANDMVPMYGYPGDAVHELSSPTLGGHEFLGWYTDKNLLNPYTALTFGDKDITLYAKWKTIPFLVDFSDYEDGGDGKRAARAKFETDANGNDYLDWWVQHATTNTSDTGTAYRVFMNKSGKHYTVETGTQYTFTFKYKLLEGNVTIKGVTNGKLNGWNSYKQHDEALVLNKVTEEWKEGTLTFTAEPEAGGKYLSFGIAGHGHVLVDDIYIEAAGGLANLYGSTAIFFNSNGGNNVDAISGDPGEAITYMPKATKPGYAFNGWFVDAECTTPFTDKTFGEENMTLYAGWLLGKFNESYEDFPTSVLSLGISGGYKIYNSTKATDFDKANVQNGETSLFRDGSQTGAKAFTVCRDSEIALTEGKQYTMTFYVKPANVTDAAGTISLIGLKTNTGIATPQSTNVITTVGDLKAGEWQKVTYTFTADSKYIGLSTTAGNDMYLDNFTVTLKGYTGTTTGDSSVNPILVVLMVVLAAGSLVVTGKKVFEK